MTRLPLLLPLVFTATAWAADFDVTLEPGKLHEECARVESGEKLAWHWKSNAPVDFNVHYHAGADVFYPIKRNAMRGDGGTFAPNVAQDYCWMWTALDKPAKIEGRIGK